MTAQSFIVSAVLYSGWRHLLEMVDEKPLIIFHVIRNVCVTGQGLGLARQCRPPFLFCSKQKVYIIVLIYTYKVTHGAF